MPLPNRVDPFGAIKAAAPRGLFTGNRGVIHDPETRTLLARRWSTMAWIVCDLVHPRGAKRVPMGRNAPSGRAGWTELFFLDEVTALAAGHRPCFYCRNRRAKAFQAAFAAGHSLPAASAPGIDAMLHGRRLAVGYEGSPLSEAQIRSLPDGAMIAFGDRAFAKRDGALLPWSFAGYGAAPVSCRTIPPGARLVTPLATIAALRAGYETIWHPSAQA